ncbi:MAG: hypothetical protein NTV10_03790 [Methanoregula sp.]|nr:hypothetical protein [Methanoregula sp.]
MASAEIIGAAIGILLMMIVAYLLVGSTLTAAEIVTIAQKDVTLQNEARLNTAIALYKVEYSSSSKSLTFKINNTGNEIIGIGDFKHMDVFITNSGNSPLYYSYNAITGTDATKTWTYSQITLTDGTTPETIHPKMLDPGEVMWVNIDAFTIPLTASTEVKVSTSNGVLDAAHVTVVP